MVRLRLSRLPMDYWVPTTILEIAAKIDKPLSLDEFTDLLWKTGYARVRMELDARKPLKPGVLIKRRKGAFWQQFIYKNLPLVCYQYGRLGYSNDVYRFAKMEPSSDISEGSLHPENVVAARGDSYLDTSAPMVDEAKGAKRGGHPRFNPWLVTSCIRQP